MVAAAARGRVEEECVLSRVDLTGVVKERDVEADARLIESELAVMARFGLLQVSPLWHALLKHSLITDLQRAPV
jgi:hypothetical protein